jgi:DNA mismatch repair protein MutS
MKTAELTIAARRCLLRQAEKPRFLLLQLVDEQELSALEGEVNGVRNYNITAKKQKGELVFLRKIVRGATDDSYGIEVAKLAGLPEAVIQKAKGYLKELESDGVPRPALSFEEEDQISLADMAAEELRRTLRDLDLNTLTPIEAMNLLFELQKKARS